MAITYMDRVTIEEYDKQSNDKGFDYSGILETAVNGDTVILPDNIKNISVTLEITAGSGKVQTTTNKFVDVLSDTDVVWVDWDDGVVTVTTQGACYPVTAIRMVNASGTTRILIRAQ